MGYQSSDKRMTSSTGKARGMCFTLIELLVVVVIIMILAAMLLPALARAKYNARLVVCMNTQKQLGQGLYIYADNHSSRYPYVYSSGHKAQTIVRSGKNRRDMLKDELPLNDLLNCPLTPVEKDYADSTSTWIEASYDLYAGFGIQGSKMDRTGARLEYNGVSYNVLAMDFIMGRSGAWGESTHPDYGTNTVRDDSRDSNPYCARWVSPARGPIDINVLYGDGSVKRFMRVRVNDPRFNLIAYHMDGGTNYKQYMPKPEE